MSNLEELIERLCPDGVEYKTLGDVATISRGGNFQKKDFTEQGKPCIHYGQIYTRYGLFTDKTLTFINDECFAKQKYAEPNDIIMAVTSENIEDICKCVAWLGTEKVAVSGHSAIIHHSLDPKYLAYFFHSQHFFNQKRRLAHGTKVMEVTPDTLKSIQLPVPPLEVQREIVQILDNFTATTTELQQKLQEELAARQKQYEYHRDSLLTFENEPDGTVYSIPWFADILCKLYPEGVEYEEIGEIATLSAGGDVPKERFSKEKTEEFNIPIYSNGIEDKSLYGFTDLSKINDPCVTISARGTIGWAALRQESFYPIVRLICVIPKERILAKFLKYVIDTIEFKVPVTGIPQLTVPMVSKYKIPVPPLVVQQRIVDILDRFDALCNDISSGLPAEIEARQKQYEYYRDKLLTFKELKKEA